MDINARLMSSDVVRLRCCRVCVNGSVRTPDRSDRPVLQRTHRIPQVPFVAIGVPKESEELFALGPVFALRTCAPLKLPTAEAVYHTLVDGEVA